MSNFCTVIFESVRHVLNPEVVKTWSARAFPGRVPSNNKEMVDKVENGRNILSMIWKGKPNLLFRPQMYSLSVHRILYDVQMSLQWIYIGRKFVECSALVRILVFKGYSARWPSKDLPEERMEEKHAKSSSVLWERFGRESKHRKARVKRRNDWLQRTLLERSWVEFADVWNFERRARTKHRQRDRVNSYNGTGKRVGEEAESLGYYCPTKKVQKCRIWVSRPTRNSHFGARWRDQQPLKTLPA